jgi:hypothetical protein
MTFYDNSSPVRTNLLTLVQGMEERARRKPRLIEPICESSLVQLPLWREELRCMPNEILRSALFNARNRNQRRVFFKNQTIGVIGQSVRIMYTGEELRQNDESVWLQLLHLAKDVPLGTAVEFTPYSMVMALRLANSKPNAGHVNRLFESLSRMQATSLAVHSKRLAHGVSMSMIPKFEWYDDATGTRLHRWRANIAPEVMELFGDRNFTNLEWKQRLALPSGLATWLHGYFGSHKEPFPLKLSTLQIGCGCATDNARKFKQLVAAALDELKSVGFLKSGAICGDLIRVERS